MMLRGLRALICGTLLGGTPSVLAAQRPDSAVVQRNDSIVVRLVDVDVRAAIQALAPFLDRPVVFGSLSPAKVTLDTPSPVAISQIPVLLRTVLQSQNLELVADTAVYRIRASDPPPSAAAAPATARQSEPLELFTVRTRRSASPQRPRRVRD